MKEFECTKCSKKFGTGEALEMHNKSKHRDSFKAPLLSYQQKKRIRNYGIALLIIIVIAGFFIWRSIPPKDAPIIEVSLSYKELGLVSQAKGEVSAMVDIFNTGSRDLIINSMDTSCGCTSAAIVYNGTEGPRFSMSMHGTNPTDWQQAIPPGDSAKLKIYYDPNVHKDMRGPVTRSIFILSNDPRHSKTEVRVHATQTD